MSHRPHNFRALSKPKKIHKSQHASYWPYIPVILLIVATLLMGTLQPFQRKGVLAYATNTSIDGLLQSTNKQRGQNKAQSLHLSQNLSAAAQAKANDMVSRNYWSHNTPDGQEPWVFIDKAGYSYQKAGENLAYGFGASEETISGWMNSPSHRENMLDPGFLDVGFGFANGQNYNNTGPETVVVAMYGSSKAVIVTNQQRSQPTPVVASLNTTKSDVKPSQSNPIASHNAQVHEPASTQVAKIQSLTNGSAPWTLFAVGLITGLSVMTLLVKHAVGIRHILRDGEKFVLHHPLLDTLLVSLLLSGSFLLQTSGFIR